MEKRPFNFKPAFPSSGIYRSRNTAPSIQIKLTGELTTRHTLPLAYFPEQFWPQEPFLATRTSLKTVPPFFPKAIPSPQCDSCMYWLLIINFAQSEVVSGLRMKDCQETTWKRKILYLLLCLPGGIHVFHWSWIFQTNIRDRDKVTDTLQSRRNLISPRLRRN